PLAGGFLTGKYTPGEPAPEGTRASQSGRIKEHLTSEQGRRVLEAVQTVAAQRRASPSQVALAWLLARPGVTSPIIGPRTIAQLGDNLGAADFRLEQLEIDSLASASAWGERSG
ncbi:MAG: aldo/keto reductase, partial [Chloroflexi bacterium]|nr:aldo/keto reductase [Chloroflexota bacterium]